MNATVKALEMYKIQTGNYPAPSSSTIASWEVSSKNPDQFLSALKTANVASSVIPVDPINNSLVGNWRIYEIGV
jgi:hypothetical protein